MAQQANYRIEKGFITTIHPKGKGIIGVGNGSGKFMWLGDEDILDFFPQPMTQWQETLFKLKLDCKKNWIDEKGFDQYGSKYSRNGKPLLPAQVPPMSFYTNMPQQVQQQGFVDPYAVQQPIQQPTQFITAAQVPLQQPQPAQPTIKAIDLMDGIKKIQQSLDNLTLTINQLILKLTTPTPIPQPIPVQIPQQAVQPIPMIIPQTQPKTSNDLPELDFI